MGIRLIHIILVKEKFNGPHARCTAVTSRLCPWSLALDLDLNFGMDFEWTWTLGIGVHLSFWSRKLWACPMVNILVQKIEVHRIWSWNEFKFEFQISTYLGVFQLSKLCNSWAVTNLTMEVNHRLKMVINVIIAELIS